VKFVCLVYGAEAAMQSVPDRECLANGAALRESGRYVAAEALRPVRETKTVRIRDGRRLVTDGPFTEAKEYLAGFYLVEAKDVDEAIEIASKIPSARVGAIEVRPVRELVP
jgi:hypothetical protein